MSNITSFKRITDYLDHVLDETDQVSFIWQESNGWLALVEDHHTPGLDLVHYSVHAEVPSVVQIPVSQDAIRILRDRLTYILKEWRIHDEAKRLSQEKP